MYFATSHHMAYTCHTRTTPKRYRKMKIDHVIKHFGSQIAVADALGVTQPTISNWKTRGRIPQLQQLRIEHMTSGKLRADRKILAKVSRA